MAPNFMNLQISYGGIFYNLFVPRLFFYFFFLSTTTDLGALFFSLIYSFLPQSSLFHFSRSLYSHLFAIIQPILTIASIVVLKISSQKTSLISRPHMGFPRILNIHMEKVLLFIVFKHQVKFFIANLRRKKNRKD